MNTYTRFEADIIRGQPGEALFEAEFLNFLGIRYRNVAGVQAFQAQDVDLDTSIGTYEIKSNYKDNKQIIIEEFTNHNPKYGNITQGWFYKTKADLLVCVSVKTGMMVLVPMTADFKCHYEEIKEQQPLIINKPTRKNNGSMWQSAFRFIPLHTIDGFYSFYKKSQAFRLT